MIIILKFIKKEAIVKKLDAYHRIETHEYVGTWSNNKIRYFYLHS